MNRFLQHSSQAAVDGRYRHGPAPTPAVEVDLEFEQQVALASWDQSPPAERVTRPDAPAARRHFQGWRVP